MAGPDGSTLIIDHFQPRIGRTSRHYNLLPSLCHTLDMSESGEAQEVITVEYAPPLLLSGRASARLLGIDPKTFRTLAAENGLQPVSSGHRKYWKRLEIERLAAIKESA